ncbi:MAG: YciI family protein [Gaiellales bacterium]
MQYAFLIYAVESGQPAGGSPEAEVLMGEYFAFTEGVRRQGVLRGGEALHPVSSATTVRVRDGEVLTTDGPFAETKEQLGGFYLLDCNDLDEAIERAAQIPSARDGSIEVRPVVVFDS